MWEVPIKSNQNLRVFLKLMNLRECVWENHCRLIMKIILQEKVRIHYSTTILCNEFTPLPEVLKIPAARKQCGQGMGNIGENFRRGR